MRRRLTPETRGRLKLLHRFEQISAELSAEDVNPIVVAEARRVIRRIAGGSAGLLAKVFRGLVHEMNKDQPLWDEFGDSPPPPNRQ